MLLSIAVPLRGFWVIDSALKHWQMTSIAENGFRGFHVNFPLARIDPTLQFNPLVWFQHFQSGNRLYLQWPPGFAFIAALFYKMIGESGPRLLILFCAVMFAVGTATLTRLIASGKSRLAGWVALFGTPVLPYAFILWEVIPAVALATWSAVFMLLAIKHVSSRYALIAGLLSGLAFLLREEYAVWCACVMLSLVISRSYRLIAPYALSCGGVALTIVTFNFLAIGKPLFLLNWSAGSDRLMSWQISTRPGVAHKLLSWASGDDVLDTLLLLMAGGLVFLTRAIRFSQVLLIGASALTAIISARYFSWDTHAPISTQIAVNSMLVSAPIVFLGFAFRKRASASLRVQTSRTFVTSLLYLFAIATVLLCPLISSMGKHFGPRMLLPIYPLGVALAFGYVADVRRANSQVHRSTIAILTLLIAVGLCDSVVYMVRLRSAVRANAQFLGYLNTFGDMPIICGPESMSQAAALLPDKYMLDFRDPNEQAAAIELARKLSPSGALLVTKAQLPKMLFTECEIHSAPGYFNIPPPDPWDWPRVYHLTWKNPGSAMQ